MSLLENFAIRKFLPAFGNVKQILRAMIFLAAICIQKSLTSNNYNIIISYQYAGFLFANRIMFLKFVRGNHVGIIAMD